MSRSPTPCEPTDGPTAVVVANDQMALGLMTALRGRGVDVPRDVSVVGFDDTPDAAYYHPPLTTVRLDVAGEARRCVAAVFGGDGSEVPGPPVLVVRSSTVAAGVTDARSGPRVAFAECYR